MISRARRRVLLSWSSGKDSAWSLHVLRQQPDIEVVGLLTTFNESVGRVNMHAVRRQLAEAQASATDLPMVSVDLPSPCPNEAYEAAMGRALDRAVSELGITGVAFGDLFLEDVRAYREDKMVQCGLEPLFPLWGLPTNVLAHEMIANGLKAYLTCIDPQHLELEFVGRLYDEAFLASLPEGVDPCGERGEFHSFAFAGPMFDSPIDVRVGEVIERDGFVFADVVPSGHP